MKKSIMTIICIFLMALYIGGCTAEREDIHNLKYGKNETVSTQQNWSVHIDSPVSSYFYDNTTQSLFLISKRAYIYELDVSNGDFKKVNMISMEADYNLPLVFLNDKFYIGSSRGRISIIDSNTLATIKALDIGISFMPSMIVSEDLIFYSEEGVKVNAINNSTFKAVWTHDERRYHMHVEPSLNNGILYFNNGKNEVVGLNAKGGRKTKVLDSSIWTPFIVQNGSLLGTNSKLNVESIDLNTGKVIWVAKGTYRELYSYEDELYAYDSEKKSIDRINENGSNYIFLKGISLAIEDLKIDKNNMYIRYSNGKVEIYNKADRDLIWEYMSDKIKFGQDALIVTDNALIIPEGDGDIHSFDLDIILENNR